MTKTFEVSKTSKVSRATYGFFVAVAVGGMLVAAGGGLVAVGGAPHRDPRRRRRADVPAECAARGKSRSGGAYARAPRAIVLFARTAWQSRAPARKANGDAGASAGSR